MKTCQQTCACITFLPNSGDSENSDLTVFASLDNPSLPAFITFINFGSPNGASEFATIHAANEVKKLGGWQCMTLYQLLGQIRYLVT
jgi:hypothetical protein